MTKSEEPKVSPFENINSDEDLMMYLQTYKPQLLGAQQDEDDATPTTADEVAGRIARKMTLENRRLARQVKNLAGELGFSRSKTINRKEMPTMVEMQAGGLTLQLSLVKGTGAYGDSRGFGIAGETVSSAEQIQQKMRKSYDLNAHLTEVVVPYGIAKKPADVHLPAIGIEAKPEIPRIVLDAIGSLLPTATEDKVLVLAFEERVILKEGQDRSLTSPAEWKLVPRQNIKKELSRDAIFEDRAYTYLRK